MSLESVFYSIDMWKTVLEKDSSGGTKLIEMKRGNVIKVAS